MSQLTSGLEVDRYSRSGFSDIFSGFVPTGGRGGRFSPSSANSRAGAPERVIAGPWQESARRSARAKASYSLRSMELADVIRAMKIAADNFRGEVGLVARSYLWHFSRRVGLGNVGGMWAGRTVNVAAQDGRSTSFDLLSSFVHDRDVAWVGLGGRTSDDIALALDAFRQWPRRHRMLVVRVDWPRAPQLLAAGFELAGRLPEADGEHVYLHAACDRIADRHAPKLKFRFRSGRSLASDCDFGVVEREGSVMGLTGVYHTEFWRDVTWGAWGAVDRSSARRDAVFEILRLTEERARASGARWFCLETSDSEKYRHARRIYELHGLELLMTVPDFYRSSDGTSEALMVYGRRLADDLGPARSLPMPARAMTRAA